MKRYLGFCPGQFGDLYMMTVAARCLKRIEPDSHLTFVINGAYRECAPVFIDDINGIDRIHILNKAKDGFGLGDSAWIEAQRYDHVFNPYQDHDAARPWWKERNQSLEAAHMHGLPTVGDDGQIRLNRWFEPYEHTNTIAISPFPTWHEGPDNPKAFGVAFAQQIVDLLIARGWNVLQVGAPSEPVLMGATKLNASYFEALRHVLGCQAMIMGDSGFNWLLSGYGFPVIGLYAHRYFGKQFLHNIQPINPNGIYLDAPTIPEIDLDRVIQAIDTITS